MLEEAKPNNTDQHRQSVARTNTKGQDIHATIKRCNPDELAKEDKGSTVLNKGGTG